MKNRHEDGSRPSSKLAMALLICGIFLTASFGALVFTRTPAFALPPPDSSCGPEIATCGCVINKPGFYQLTGNIFAPPTTKTGNCIDIKASGTVLELNGYGMLGASNSGVGIDVYKQALNTTIEGRTSTNGSIGSVRAFDIGIEDNADNALIDGIYASGNNTAAFMLKNVKNSRLLSSNASSNGSYGIWLQNSKYNTIGTDSALGEVYNNSVYGIWLQGSNFNSIANIGITKNGIGVYMGSPGAPKKVSFGNSLTGTNLDYNTTGVEIDNGNLNNRTGVNLVGPSHSELTDFMDQNPTCDHNKWFNNVFYTANQTCIR